MGRRDDSADAFRRVGDHGECVPFGVWGGVATVPAAGAFGA